MTKNRQQIVSSRRSPVARVTVFLLIIECIVLGICFFFSLLLRLLWQEQR